MLDETVKAPRHNASVSARARYMLMVVVVVVTTLHRSTHLKAVPEYSEYAMLLRTRLTPRWTWSRLLPSIVHR